MKQIVIQPLTMQAYSDVLALWQRCSGIGLSGADSETGIARYLARNPGMSFIAQEGDTIIGSILCGHDGRRGYIHHLAVDEGYRRHGIGSALVEHCLAALAEAGIQKCHLFIFHENYDGIDFWQANEWTLRQDIRIMSRHLDQSQKQDPDRPVGHGANQS